MRSGSVTELGPARACRAERPTPPEDGVLTPVLCVVAQGVKEVVVGSEHHVYGAGCFLVNSVQLPGSGRTLKASHERPCLWLSIRIDPRIVEQVAERWSFPDPLPMAPLRSIDVGRMDVALLRAVLNLAWLFDDQASDDFLVELAMSELVHRLLASDQANRVRQIIARDGGSPQVVRAIRWVREHFTEPLSVQRLARAHGLSPSVLHLRFKQLTAMSPLQFQKQLRLQEAKRLIASDDLGAAEAAARVGYESPSHFSRDFRRLFGASPRRHVEAMREGVRGPF